VGYIIAGSINMIAFKTPWQEAFSNEKLITGFIAIALGVFFIVKSRKPKAEIDS